MTRYFQHFFPSHSSVPVPSQSKYPFYHAAMITTMALSSGCETTGDPRQGALFGWSEGKARDRQALLRQQLEDVNTDNRTVSSRSASLRASQSSLGADVSAKSARLNALEGQVASLQEASASGRATPAQTRQRAEAIERKISPQDASDPQMQELLGRVKDLAR